MSTTGYTGVPAYSQVYGYNFSPLVIAPVYYSSAITIIVRLLRRETLLTSFTNVLVQMQMNKYLIPFAPYAFVSQCQE